MRPVRVVVVDDQDLVRVGFVALLSATAGVEVVGEARQGEEAVRLARTSRPQVVLMDVRMPVLNGIEATRRITGDPECAGCHVIMLTTFGLDDYVFGALRAGAVGFLLKDTPPEDLIRAVRTVAAGDSLLSPSITRRLIEAFAATPPPPTLDQPATVLPAREADVLVLVGRGLSNAEIARSLHIGPATVKTYISRLFSNVGATTRVHPVIHAYETGLLGSGPAGRSRLSGRSERG
ncbi:response regulator [Dactylosporangium sp. CS-047395]|uniref:response regulator n=1 Tax=Dactylosporangium sp. CS-047395 TaxID=3239936 RepID=UPI003D9470B1